MALRRFRRFTEWAEVRVWAKLHHRVLDELGAQGGLDRTRCAIDSVLSYALEAGGAGTRKASWLYCFDKAGNLTSRDGSKSACPGGTAYTYNDASELSAKNGSTTGLSYDKLGNETAAASTTARTGESWTDDSQLSGITTGGKSYDLVHAGTSNAERTKLGDTWFHHTALGLASTTTNGFDTGFIREPAGTLNSMTAGREVLLLPHRRHRQRPRPRRRHRQAHPHLRVWPHRPPAHHTHGFRPPSRTATRVPTQT